VAPEERASVIDPARAAAEAVRCPEGFAAGGVACGIKKRGGPDLALFAAGGPVAAAGLFTRNRLRAAPLEISIDHLRRSGGRARAILVNSGCANAATGPAGLDAARRMARAAASALGCAPEHVLVNSTGVIGVALPVERLEPALPRLRSDLDRDGLGRAAAAIMTTDTHPKVAQVRVAHGGRSLHVAGVAKGSGMIHPDMATMIAVLLTDAQLEPAGLDGLLRRAAERSFHRISVDGDTSTNDSVFAMASGCAGVFPEPVVADAMERVARELALAVVRDGEGARKLIHVRVRGGRDDGEALGAARAVAGSLLVRTAVTGGDPNWGRILAALGRSGVEVDFSTLRVTVGGVRLFESGAPADSPLTDRERAFAGPTVTIDIDLARGAGSDECFTCDLTEGYVEINSRYTT
jgi:glutamate N-acetyltransferase/amino-acid N-acetyltransferase